MEPQTTGVKTWQWVVTAIVIIALIVIGIFVFGNKKTEMPALNETIPTETNVGLNSITMTDQYPGNKVYLTSVQVANPSWVVIQADNAGMPGAILGAAHFDKGINPGTVNLTKSTIDGNTYYAVIYTDDGSGKFDAVKDVPLKDSNGKVIMRIFKASAAADMNLKG